jgi:hypothetical protein
MMIVINFGHRATMQCADLQEAKRLFIACRETGDSGFGFGASDMHRDCGNVYDHGKHIATIHYNGRIEEHTK